LFGLKDDFLTQAKEFAYLINIALVYKCDVVEITLLLLGLLGQNVTVISVFSFNLTRSGKGEPLFGTGISLYFWHFLYSFGY